MTPLSRFFEAFLPVWLVWPVLALTYMLMLATLVLLPARADLQPVIYIDVNG